MAQNSMSAKSLVSTKSDQFCGTIIVDGESQNTTENFAPFLRRPPWVLWGSFGFRSQAELETSGNVNVTSQPSSHNASTQSRNCWKREVKSLAHLAPDRHDAKLADGNAGKYEK